MAMGEVERFWPQLETTVLSVIGVLGVMSRAEDMVAAVQSDRLLDIKNAVLELERIMGVDSTKSWRDGEIRWFLCHRGAKLKIGGS